MTLDKYGCKVVFSHSALLLYRTVFIFTPSIYCLVEGVFYHGDIARVLRMSIFVGIKNCSHEVNHQSLYFKPMSR